MDLEPIIARLKGAATGLKAIGGAADLDAALAGVVPVPSAFVIPISDSASALESTGAYDEWDWCEFGVILAVASLQGARGEAALGALVPMRRQVRAALSGWAPDQDTGEPVQKTRGHLLRLDGDGRLWWMDQFRWKSFYRSNP
ncbi:MAG: hypothetical protein JSR53_09490 [Proteobacteria bacterium]|nr:hypothetical protein [Pseudomonadota bacterium]